jgi:hypothetical protein
MVELTELGTRLKLSGYTEQGLCKYFEALKQNPSYSPVYYNIGVVYPFIQFLDKEIEIVP